MVQHIQTLLMKVIYLEEELVQFKMLLIFMQ